MFLLAVVISVPTVYYFSCVRRGKGCSCAGGKKRVICKCRKTQNSNNSNKPCQISKFFY